MTQGLEHTGNYPVNRAKYPTFAMSESSHLILYNRIENYLCETTESLHECVTYTVTYPFHSILRFLSYKLSSSYM